jgi:hypothetical protein
LYWPIVLLVFLNSNFPANHQLVVSDYAPAFPALLSVNKKEFEETEFSRNAGTLEQAQHVPT